MADRDRRAFLIVLDGVGIGAAPDAGEYGDAGANTLAHVAGMSGGVELPVLARLGLGNIASLTGVRPARNPQASHGLMRELGAGKDSITGHWELCGVINDTPFPTYPDGFPGDVVALVERISGRDVIGNEAASGTEIMQRLGAEHLRTGALIIYTSADSVLQILAHERVVPLAELYRICERIRRQLPREHRVGRVIARPFAGEQGGFERTANRRDFAVEPPDQTLLDQLMRERVRVHGIGKVDTLFAGRGFTSRTRTKSNTDGIIATLERIRSTVPGLVFTNLLDFDTRWGHRNDVAGFAKGLEDFDKGLKYWVEALRPGDLMILTADHGNDPTFPGTDHTRELVPLLAWHGGGIRGRDLGLRHGFADVAATVAAHFGLEWNGPGESFLSDVPYPWG
ncbi:MAG: Phosphopentomutase [Calditrichaeota bacterium]|nr:Phosphopentomutase [Calditrichota bacterium]